MVGSAPGVGGSFRGGDPSSFRGSEGWIHRASFSAKGKSPPDHQGERRSCGHSSSSRGASPPQQREGSPPGSRGSREGSGHASRAAGAVASHHPHQPPRAKLINPFIGAELMKVVGATKTLSSFSCALRRVSDAAGTHTSSHLPLLSLRRYARRRWLHVSQHLEHQWTSLSEPAVLPVATEATVEHELKRLGNTELLNWNLEVAALSLDRSSLLTSRLAPPLTPLLLPLQVAGLAAAHMAMPYEMPMSAEELLQELVCQRLDQDFQLLGSMQHSGSEDRRVYFLSHSQQLQIITMTKERKSTMRG